MSRFVHNVLLSMMLLIMILSACSHLKPFTDISSKQAHDLIHASRTNPNFILLDVRTPGEYTVEHLEGAHLIDFRSADFSARIDSLDKTASYLVYCRSGGRSAKTMALMKIKGFRRVYNLKGGILQWKKENRPVKIE